MKKFTVKDFIAYNNPCFGCDEHISFKIGIVTDDLDGSAEMRPTVKPEYTVVDLKTTYNKILQLWIFHTSNKIMCSDGKDLAQFLTTNKIFLQSRCNKCLNGIQSQYLEFNLDKGFVKPTGVSREMFTIKDDTKMYQVTTNVAWGTTTVVVDRLDRTIPTSPLVLNLPLLPLYKFKIKARLIEKIKTYITFS